MKYYLARMTQFRSLPRDWRKITKTLRNTARSRRAETLIVSFPKTGRTWLRIMIGRALIERYGLDEGRLLDTYELTARAGLGRAMFSHGGPLTLMDGSAYERTKYNRSLYERKKIIYLVRDVRDTLVSFYFHLANRERVFKGNVQSFARDRYYGAAKIVSHYTLWYRNRHVPREFLPIRYEDMHARPGDILRRVLEFLGADDITDDIVKRAVAYSRFDHMKAMESANRFKDDIMRPGDRADADSFKVRRGKVGGYADYLSEADLEHIDEVIETIGDPACDWYLHREGAASQSVTPERVCCV